jgi:hypothetical protein
MMYQETREAIINDLYLLGVHVDTILKHNPTEKMLKDLRDGLIRLHDMPDLMVATRSMMNSL